jgi:hypothetical protein
MAEITKLENLEDKITVTGLIEFLEYEEAITTAMFNTEKPRGLVDYVRFGIG